VINESHPLVSALGIDDVQNLVLVLMVGKSYRGDMDVDGSVLVMGQVTGSLKAAGTIYVAPTGTIAGSAAADRIVLAGAIMGDSAQCDRLVLLADARLQTGKIEFAQVKLPETGGAFISGRMERVQARRPVDAPVVLQAPAESADDVAARKSMHRPGVELPSMEARRTSPDFRADSQVNRPDGDLGAESAADRSIVRGPPMVPRLMSRPAA
jgi:cytoskeletal protein CcmA (bactofilin family)